MAIAPPTPRTRAILGRFPRHLAVDEPGTLFAEVVDALSSHLDRQTAQLGRVRTAHRLGMAEERRDLLLLASLHDLGEDQLDLLERRFADLRALLARLPGEPDAIDELDEVLGVAADAFPAWPGEADGVAALARLTAAARALAAAGRRLAATRTLLRGVIDCHRAGNGTIGALLHGAAARLGLAGGTIRHSDDRYWHFLPCLDRLRLERPEAPGAVPQRTMAVPREDLLALEENPFVDAAVEPADHHHGDAITISRLGFDPVPVTVIVVGRGDRTLQPMVVDVDGGLALVHAATLPDGAELRFHADGSATVDGADVGTLCYAIRGGVFADADAAHARDFVFADADGADAAERAATFGVTTPAADLLDGGAIPHAGGALPAARLAVGETRFRVFVREGCFGGGDPASAEDPPSAAIPRFAAGILDASGFAAAAAGEPSFAIGFAWRERETFACTLWIPERFRRLDAVGEGSVATVERLRLQLERHRPAGVRLRVAHADTRWELGVGILRDPGSSDPEGTIIVGTGLWNLADLDADPI